jgi:hypothetical protein
LEKLKQKLEMVLTDLKAASILSISCVLTGFFLPRQEQREEEPPPLFPPLLSCSSKSYK